MLSPEQRRFVRTHYLISTVLFNLAFNAGVGYLAFAKQAPVLLWGEASLGVDVIATGIVLALLTHLILGRIIGKDIATGKVQMIPATQQHSLLARYYPRHLLGAALTTTVLTLLIAVPVVLVALQLFALEQYSLWQAVTLKALYGALFALFVVPLIARASLREPQATTASA